MQITNVYIQQYESAVAFRPHVSQPHCRNNIQAAAFGFVQHQKDD